MFHYARNHLQDDWAAQALADADARRAAAEAEAGWYFDRATVRQRAVFDAAIRALLDRSGADADLNRELARSRWCEATREAQALFDETVACLLGCGEVSESLDERWSALCARQVAIAAE